MCLALNVILKDAAGGDLSTVSLRVSTVGKVLLENTSAQSEDQFWSSPENRERRGEDDDDEDLDLMPDYED